MYINTKHLFHLIFSYYQRKSLRILLSNNAWVGIMAQNWLDNTLYTANINLNLMYQFAILHSGHLLVM